jgi:hypothetical protein
MFEFAFSLLEAVASLCSLLGSMDEWEEDAAASVLQVMQ